MRRVDGRLVFSPTDLVGFLSCDHLARLDHAAFDKLVHRPKRPDEELELLIAKGLEHEQRYLEHLRAEGLGVTEIVMTDRSEAGLLEARDRTLDAMARGDDVIYQATFVEDGWSGQADFLRRVERPDNPSSLGPWGYEPEDTKLALSAKAGAVLQLLTYARMISAVQGDMPEHVHVVLGRAEVTKATFRTADFAAFHRLILGRLEDQVGAETPTTDLLDVVRDPVDHCTFCPWQEHCGSLRFRSGHLSRVAFIRRDEIEKLRTAGIGTVWALGGLEQPLPEVDGLAADVLVRLADQASMQLQEERTGIRFHKILEHPEPPPHRGLLALPEPSPLDIFFDFEGDRFATEGGLEYLFGWVEAVEPDAEPTDAPFHALWAHDREQECAALEQFLDYVTERRQPRPRHARLPLRALRALRAPQADPAPRHAAGGARRPAPGRRLRRPLPRRPPGRPRVVQVLLDQAVREAYDLVRDEDGIAKALSSMLAYERWLASGDQAILDSIGAYNRDDCVSTLMLRDWLEERRGELLASLGADPGRPPLVPGDAPEDGQAADDEAAQVRAALMADIDPAIPDTEPLAEEPQARRLLGNLVGWHRREARTEWFEWYRLRALDRDGLRRENATIGVSAYDGVVGRDGRSDVHRWRFDPAQEIKLHRGDKVVAVPPLDPADTSDIGPIFRLDLEEGVLELKVGARKTRDGAGIDGFIPTTPIGTTEQRKSILELGKWVVEHGIDADGPNRAARDVLLGRPPRVRGVAAGGPLLADGEDPSLGARRLALALDDSYLPIQGPPGSGKTYTGAKIILDLVRTPAPTGERRVVGVTAFSHAAIGQLLREVVKHAGQGSGLRIIQKADEDDWCGAPAVERVDNKEVDARLAAGTVDIVAGTPWLWSRPALEGAVDTLVVDEAGQISLANLAAIGRAARNLVLLGDPQQLSQPVKGAHPPGAEKSRTRAGARRAPGHPTGARRLPRNHEEAPSRHLRVHLGALLRGAAGDARRPRAPGRPGRRRTPRGQRAAVDPG